jgi:hypothetical protein
MARIGKILLAALILGGTLVASGCVVEPRRPPPPPARAPGCVWIAGHYNAHGYWVPGYCRR